MTETATPTVSDAQPPLGPLQLAGAGLRALWTHIAPMALLALAATILATGLAVVAREVGESFADGAVSAGHWGHELLKALLSAVVAGVALRLLLGAAGRFRLDRGAGLYVGLVTAAGFLTALLFGLLASADDPQGVAQSLLLLLAGFACAVLTTWVYARLLLWPIGRLMGEAVPPGRSWALMGGATLGYLLAIVICVLPTLIPYVILSLSVSLEVGGDSDALPTILVDEAFRALWTLIGAAIAAAVYRARVLGERV